MDFFVRKTFNLSRWPTALITTFLAVHRSAVELVLVVPGKWFQCPSARFGILYWWTRMNEQGINLVSERTWWSSTDCLVVVQKSSRIFMASSSSSRPQLLYEDAMFHNAKSIKFKLNWSFREGLSEWVSSTNKGIVNIVVHTFSLAGSCSRYWELFISMSPQIRWGMLIWYFPLKRWRCPPCDFVD